VLRGFLLWRYKPMRGMVWRMATRASLLAELEAEPLIPARGVAAVVIGALASLILIALLLIARRVSGDITAELPLITLSATALAALAIVTGTRMLWRRTFLEDTTIDAWIGWTGSATMVLLAIGVSFPSQRVEDWIVWLPVLVVDQLVRRRVFESHDRVEEEFKIAKPFATANLRQTALRAEQVQQIVRSRDAAGHEMVHAMLRADFVAGQRTATVYVGFCPPLAGRPEITIEAASGPSAEFKIVQVFSHGARIDVRLASTAVEAMGVVLNVTANA
jgi:hypothetical protein